MLQNIFAITGSLSIIQLEPADSVWVEINPIGITGNTIVTD